MSLIRFGFKVGTPRDEFQKALAAKYPNVKVDSLSEIPESPRDGYSALYVDFPKAIDATYREALLFLVAPAALYPNRPVVSMSWSRNYEVPSVANPKIQTTLTLESVQSGLVEKYGPPVEVHRVKGQVPEASSLVASMRRTLQQLAMTATENVIFLFAPVGIYFLAPAAM
jgi:hypothetical protein